MYQIAQYFINQELLGYSSFDVHVRYDLLLQKYKTPMGVKTNNQSKASTVARYKAKDHQLESSCGWNFFCAI